ncbi:serine/threonine-protein kinase [Kitasatospora azatica]|uniref:serine/threonine-protein kinase n=1 Tax=Kitasatospora azatica TaxID=58347 RepID=UPI00068996E4|nr:serine/threonine-protein kinase [Kitasatospora azatica]
MSDLEGYQLLRELESGATGTVWEAVDRQLGHRVAVHIAPAGAPAELVERFQQEAAAVGKLAHPHLVAVQHVTGRALVTELLSGRTLDTAGRADIGHLLVWAQQAFLGLQAAHALGVVHWALKPGRLLVTEQGGLKLLGFGTAYLAPATETGNGPYLAPEQWRQVPADGRADLYALGCVIFELITGHPPYTGATAEELMHRHLSDPVPSPAAHRPGLPPALDQLVQALLAKDPAARPADAATVRVQLGTIAAGYHGESDHSAQGQLRAQVDQAWAYGEAGHPMEAVRLLTALTTQAARTLGPTAPPTLQIAYDLAIWRGMADDIAGAAGLLADLVPLMTATLGPGDEDVAKATRDLWSYRTDLERKRNRQGTIARPGELAMLLGLPAYHLPA